MADETDYSEKVFQAAQIEKIVWIDDAFSIETDHETLVSNILQELNNLNDAGRLEASINHALLKDIDLDEPMEVWLDKLSKQLALSSENVISLSQHLDLTDQDAHIPIVQDALNKTITVETLTYEGWLKDKAAFLKEPQGTLFLVDLDFTKEGQAENAGVEILEEILSAEIQAGGCVLCTNTVQNQDQEEAERKRLFNNFIKLEVKIAPYLFSVLSKSTLHPKSDKEKIKTHIPIVIQNIFIRKICGTMAESIQSQMSEAAHGQYLEIANQNVYDLDRVIFKNSLGEGASEFDVMFRVLQLAQKTTVTDVLKENSELVGQLKQLRDLQKATPKSKKIDTNTSATFAKIHEQEYWDDEESINMICSPLTNGDIFIADDDRKYVLIAQPCDLTVRGKNGTRKPYDGILAPLKEETRSTKQESDESKNKVIVKPQLHLIDDVSNELKHYVVDFSKTVNVNLDVLDWCVYNQAGDVKISNPPLCSDLVYLPGWLIRFNDLLVSMQGGELPNNLQFLSSNYRPLNGKTGGICYDPQENDENNEWSTGLKRIRRLRDPYAEHLLSNYFSFKARKAFDHDFSKSA